MKNKEISKKLVAIASNLEKVAGSGNIKQIYTTSFCNHGHYLHNGRPVNHECYILPPAALQAERDGDYDLAQEIMAKSRGRLKVVNPRKVDVEKVSSSNYNIEKVLSKVIGDLEYMLVPVEDMLDHVIELPSYDQKGIYQNTKDLNKVKKYLEACYNILADVQQRSSLVKYHGKKKS